MDGAQQDGQPPGLEIWGTNSRLPIYGEPSPSSYLLPPPIPTQHSTYYPTNCKPCTLSLAPSIFLGRRLIRFGTIAPEEFALCLVVVRNMLPGST